MTAPPGDWPGLAAAVRSRRLHLGIHSIADAAARAGISMKTWQRLESGIPTWDKTLIAVSRALGWRSGEAWAILNGQYAPEKLGLALPAERPALVYLTTDGRVVQLDRGDLTELPARERALCAALLDHARAQLDQAGVSAIADDHQDGHHD